MSKRENANVKCPICSVEFVTSTDSFDTQCPQCGFKFELEQRESK